MKLNNRIMREILEQYDWLQDLFKSMPDDLLDQWHKYNYEPGDLICEQDEMAEFFYIVLDGKFKVQCKMLNGSEFSIADMEAGELVSDIELALECPYIYNVVAVSKGSTIALKARLYKAWIRQDPHFLMYLSTSMARKLYESSQNTIRLKKGSIRLHILQMLFNWTSIHRYDQNALYTQCFTTKERKEMASNLGVHVRSIIRVLKDLESQEVIQLSNGRITISIVQNTMIHQLLKQESVW